MGGGSGRCVPGWEPRGVFCNHNMISCAEQRTGRERPAEARLRQLQRPFCSGSPGLLWNSLCARCCHALGCEWHLALGRGLLEARKGLKHQEAILWGHLGTAGPGRKRAVPRWVGGGAGQGRWSQWRPYPAARQGGTWACLQSWRSSVPTASSLRPAGAGPLGAALSHRLGTGLGSGVQGLGAQDGSGASLFTVVLGLRAKQLPPRPPESPGNFPVTAGSAARAIYNSHSRLCLQ